MIKKALQVFICLLLILTFVFVLAKNRVNAASKPVYYIVTNPGEDASRTMNVTWEAEEAGSYLLYTFANDEAFGDAIRVNPSEEYWSTEGIVNTQPYNTFKSQKRYVCKLTIDNLKPATKYIYKVVSGTYNSKIYHFTTAGLTNNWNFLAFTDFQCESNSITHPLIRQMLEIGNNPPLVICSGDEIDTAGDENEWKWFFNKDENLFTQFIYASSPGDHEYWGASLDGSYPQYAEPYTYNKLFTYPQNGVDEAKNSNYYFYYNNVLFVALDMGDSNTTSSTKIDSEATWLKETVERLEGTFQYLVVFNHKSIYGAYKEDSGVHKKITPQWYPVFDECNVDLVLSGHDHMYSRTYRLYNNAVTTDTSIGTYYLDMGSSGDKRRTTEAEITNDGLHEKTYDLKSLSLSCGANIEVSPEEMVVTVYNNRKQAMDKFVIAAKRNPLDISCDGFDQDEFFDNVKLDGAGKNAAALIINDVKNVGYINKIQVKNNGNICGEHVIDYNNILKAYSLSNVNSEKLIVKAILKDGTEYEKELSINLGTLDSLKTKFNKKDFSLVFDELIFKVFDYKVNIYVDDVLLRMVSDDEFDSRNLNLDMKYFHGSHKFTVKFETDDKVLYETSINYNNDKQLIITKDVYNLNVGESTKLEYSYEYKEIVSFASSNPNIVDVDNDGNIKALGKGDAKIEILVAGMEPYSVSVSVQKKGLGGGCKSGAYFVTSFIAAVALIALIFKKNSK